MDALTPALLVKGGAVEAMEKGRRSVCGTLSDRYAWPMRQVSGRGEGLAGNEAHRGQWQQQSGAGQRSNILDVQQ